MPQSGIYIMDAATTEDSRLAWAVYEKLVFAVLGAESSLKRAVEDYS